MYMYMYVYMTIEPILTESGNWYVIEISLKEHYYYDCRLNKKCYLAFFWGFV